jgi:hypothetical protein
MGAFSSSSDVQTSQIMPAAREAVQQSLTANRLNVDLDFLRRITWLKSRECYFQICVQMAQYA